MSHQHVVLGDGGFVTVAGCGCALGSKPDGTIVGAVESCVAHGGNLQPGDCRQCRAGPTYGRQGQLRMEVMHCPRCNVQHIEQHPWSTFNHLEHRCLSCGHQWRVPVANVGVQAAPPLPPPGPDACPRCGEEDLTKPCLGSDATKDGVRKPLKYRHNGRKPNPRIQPSLDGPALTDSKQWDTEALR